MPVIKLQDCSRLAVALSSAFLTQGSLAQDFRQDPACLEEQLTKQMALAKILVYQQGQSGLPGNVIIERSNWGPHWKKIEMHEIHRHAVKTWPLGQFVTKRRYVEIHLMVNVATKEVKQVKFKNTIEQGCDGTFERGGEIRPRPNGNASDIGFGAAPSRKGEVIVSPVRPAEHPPFPGHTSCGACHAGSMGSSNRMLPLKTQPHRFSVASGSEPARSSSSVAKEDFAALATYRHRLIAEAQPPHRGRVLDSLL